MPGKRNAALGFIFITVLLDVISLGVIIPVFPFLIEELIQGTETQAAPYAGLLLFISAFMQFLFAPLLGGLSDRFGRRPVLLLSLLGLGINYLVHAVAPTMAWLFVVRIFTGIFGASFTTAYAYVADISKPEKKAQNFGMIMAAFGLGFIIGPVMGGLLSKWGIRTPFIVSAILTFLNFFYGLFLVPESLASKSRRVFSWVRANPVGTLQHLRKYPVVLGLIITVFLLQTAMHAVQSTWTFFTQFKFDWKSEEIGYSLGFAGILIVLIQGGLIRYIIPKLGPKTTVKLGLLTVSIGLLLFGMATREWMMYVFLIPYTLGGLAGPAIQAITSNQVPADEQGELQGGITSVMSITNIVGPPLMTGLFAWFANENSFLHLPGAPFFAGVLLVLIAFLLSLPSLNRLTPSISREE